MYYLKISRNSRFLILILIIVSVAFAIIDPVTVLAQETPVAIVNGDTIFKSELDIVIEQYKKSVDKNEVTDEEVNKLLQGLIRRKLILALDSVDRFRNNPEIVNKVKAFEDQLIIQYFLQEHIGRSLTVSDEEVETYYRENLYRFTAPPSVKASHILLRNEKEAQVVQTKLENGGDFHELAAEYSIDLPMALEGGSMGTIEKGKTLPQLEEALFAMDEGEYSDIIKTPYGFHILTVDEIITAQYKPLDEVKTGIRQELMRQKEAEAFNAMVERLEEKAQIQIYENKIKKESGN